MNTKIHCNYDQLVAIEELLKKQHPRNPNKHPDTQIKRLAEILQYQGFRYPLKVSKLSGYITAGHGRLLAAKHLGLKVVPVNYQDYIDDAQEYADIVADNAIASWAELDLSSINTDIADFGPEFNVDMLGLENFTVEVSEKLEPQCDEDEIPEKVEPKTKLGDIYKLGNHRLMCGDSTALTDVEKLMDGNKVDMVFTDPPYGIDIVSRGCFGDGKKYGSMKAKHNFYRDVKNDDSTKTAHDAFNLCKSFNIETMIFWGANFYPSVLDEGMSWLVWDKEVAAPSFSDCEIAFVNKFGKLRIYKHQWSGMIKDSERCERRVHPTQKPVALSEFCFDTYGRPKNVLDLFGGSGSTLIACEKTNRKCFMMELDPSYCDVIVSRWEKYTGRKAELING